MLIQRLFQHQSAVHTAELRAEQLLHGLLKDIGVSGDDGVSVIFAVGMQDDAVFGEVHHRAVAEPALYGGRAEVLLQQLADRSEITYATNGDVYKSFLVKEGMPEIGQGDATHYTWHYGIKGGYMGEMFTVAGHAIFGYGNTETFNWNNKDFSSHTMALGLDGQIIITDWLNVTMGVEYLAQLDSHNYIDGEEVDLAKNRGTWSGILGLNFNIDETKYVGVYVNGGLHHEKDEASEIDNKSAWKVDTGMGMGVKFGIDF